MRRRCHVERASSIMSSPRACRPSPGHREVRKYPSSFCVPGDKSLDGPMMSMMNAFAMIRQLEGTIGARGWCRYARDRRAASPGGILCTAELSLSTTIAIEWSSLVAQAKPPARRRDELMFPHFRAAEQQPIIVAVAASHPASINENNIDVDPFVWRSRRELKRFAGSISVDTVSLIIIDHHQPSPI